MNVVIVAHYKKGLDMNLLIAEGRIYMLLCVKQHITKWVGIWFINKHDSFA